MNGILTTTPLWPGLLADNRSWLRSVIYARVRCWGAVDDVLQETALAASKKGDPASDREGVSRWLYRVALRQSLLHIRTKTRFQNKVDRLHCEQNGSARPYESPADQIAACEDQQLVRGGLECLSNRECEILLLKYSEGWSCTEIASRLDVKVSTVKSRLLRARNNLRKHLLRLSKDWEP